MSEAVKIAFFDTKPYDFASFDEANRSFNYRIKYIPVRLNPDTAVMADGYKVVCAFVNDDLGVETIDRLYDLGVQLIAMRCAGYNNVDIKAAYGKIHVARVPAYSPYSVAEHTIALMLSLNRKVHKAYSRTRDSNFSINGFLGFDMHDKTVGVIGLGKIGKVLIGILKGFGTKILAYDPFPDDELAREMGFDYVNLDQLLADSDIISLHCPLTPETHHIINAGNIAKMKDGVMLINTSRGGLVDTPALIEGLKKRKIGYAGLDVYEEESDYFFEDFSAEVLDDDILARLLTFPNVLVTSHQAFFTREALQNIATTTLNNIRDFSAGKNLENEICYKCESNPCRKKEEGKCF